MDIFGRTEERKRDVVTEEERRAIADWLARNTVTVCPPFQMSDHVSGQSWRDQRDAYARAQQRRRRFARAEKRRSGEE